MMRAFLHWLDHRTGYRAVLNETLYEPVPGGAKWRYVWGSTLVFTFALQMITGIFLWSAYSPSTQTAWESVFYIQHVMWLGNIVRGVHHYAAQAMVVLLAIHFAQVVIDGAYKAPREVNFWLGMVLLQIVLGLSLTGYLLPLDQKGYYATRVSTNIMGATPIVGSYLQDIVQGGPDYGHHTLTRFFMMHAGILPGLLIAFLLLHIYVFRRHGITAHRPEKNATVPFWPDQVFRDAVACLGVLTVVLLLAVFRGAELSAPASATEPYAAARPEWYFLFLFRFLKFEAVEHFGLAFGAIYVPGAVMALLLAMPITAMIWRKGHTFNVALMALVSVGMVALTVMAMVEDAKNEDHQAAVAEAERDGMRVVEIAKREERIPPEGAVSLLAKDPFTQGPRLFARHCSSCHRYDGHNGRGAVIAAVDAESGRRKIIMPEAADLGDFASRGWMRNVLLNFEEHFRPIRFSARYVADEDEHLDPDSSAMADWSGEREALRSPENAKDIDALTEFMVSEAGHEGIEVDEELVERGRSLAIDGEWHGALEGAACTNCHSTVGEPFIEDPADDSGGYPDIRKYGSAEWLRAFIRDPGSVQFYGSKNQMPAFADKLSEAAIESLVAWLTRDYYATEVEGYTDRKQDVEQAMSAVLESP